MERDEPSSSTQAEPVQLVYATPRKRWGFGGLFEQSALAETLIGIGWTCSGFATLMTVFYLVVFGRGLLWPLVLVCLVLNAIGAVLCLGSLLFRPWEDVLLRNLLIASLAVSLVGGILQALWFI
ncbi:MAG: hypothetical protein AAGK78_07590 [Planctomycetota bacterium]